MNTKEIYIAWECLKRNKNNYTKEELKREQKRLRLALKKAMRPKFEAEPKEVVVIKNLFGLAE